MVYCKKYENIQIKWKRKIQMCMNKIKKDSHKVLKPMETNA